MNGRSKLPVYFLLVFLAIGVILQLMSLVQSKRVYERLDGLVERFEAEPTKGIG